jgi:hypothetical protein
MRGSYFQQAIIRASRFTDAVEKAAAKRAEEAEAAELKRARILNGAEPGYKRYGGRATEISCKKKIKCDCSGTPL